MCDPDGRLAAFGLPDPATGEAPASERKAARLPARLRHVVVATTARSRLARFYKHGLGFVVSDDVGRRARDG
ncbi:MAG: hypothetical protein ACT4P2_06735 [Pseudomonadota bacterium]